MRTLGELAHPKCRITLFAWNGKFIVRFEQGPCEQSYKFDQFEVETESELRNKLNDDFIEKVLSRFEPMHSDRLELLD